MPGGSRSLPVRPSLRFLKLEAKRRLAAGEFATLHDWSNKPARWPHTGLGWLLTPGDQTAVHGGAGPDAAALLRSRVRDGRTHVVLTSRMITIESIDNRLLRSVTNPTDTSIRG